MSLRSFVGNTPAVDRLRKMVTTGRVPAGLLFCGASGVGKRLAALSLAKALNCARAIPASPESAGSDDACDECPACRRIDRGEHPDVRLFHPDGKGMQIRVEAIRDLVHEIYYRPFEGRRRVFILNDADALNPSAGNALLKSLEEPPPLSHVILVTAHDASLLETLRSRCQKVYFRPLLPEEVEAVLVQSGRLDGAEARLAAAASGGDVSRALAVPVPALALAREDALELTAALVGGTSRGELLAKAELLAKDDGFERQLHMTLGLLRDLLALSAGTAARLVHSDLEARLELLSKKAPPSTWIEAYSRVERALRALDQYSNKKLTAETLLLELSELAAPRKGAA